MKRTIIIFAAALLLTSCGLADSPMGELETYSYFEITSDGTKFSKDFDEIEFTIHNSYSETLGCDAKWEFEKNVDGVWKTIPYAKEGWILLMYTLLPEKEMTFSIKAEEWDYKFDKGKYRYYNVFKVNAQDEYAVFEFELE